MPEWIKQWWESQSVAQWLESQGQLPQGAFALVILFVSFFGLKVAKRLLVHHSRHIAESRGIV